MALLVKLYTKNRKKISSKKDYTKPNSNYSKLCFNNPFILTKNLAIMTDSIIVDHYSILSQAT